jgi:flagellar hook-basal body complex protein FliE
MIENNLVPNVNIFSNVSSSMPIDEFSQKGFGVSNLNQQDGVSFKNVLSGLVSNLNNDVEKPDQLLNQQMMGNSDVDIHDVMTAISKAELGVSLASQLTSKVVTAYNTVMNISI